MISHQMVNNFSLAINEVAPDDHIQHPKEHEYSPLFKDFQQAEMSGKKYKKQFSTIKDYGSNTEGRQKDQGKHRVVESSMTDLNNNNKNK